ncbi:HEAT repeat domain-containing protein [Chondromyces crocatus]|uniref:Ribosomal RNA large subunit methyltransferase K/L-like methyltransferase domain-containing protein n=1 Tax=Chondromyces crocatus TaxID=52 RepID=A0A0K1ER94_CHOCO|nr:HEAT repeat domain-containing protein [Chondromyces crocatus]AKT43167.1 uncharacterized protein CMC5_073970 [Chondromyces crocatus]
MIAPATAPALASALTDPGFTPGRRHFSELLDLVARGDESLGELAEKALRRVGSAALPAALARAADALPRERALLIRLIGRIAMTLIEAPPNAAPPSSAATPSTPVAPAGEAQEGQANDMHTTSTEAAPLAAVRAFLLAQLRDEDARTRRLSAVALGKLGEGPTPGEMEEALLAAARQETSLDARRAMLSALGRVGGREALALLEGLSLDQEVDTARSRAALMVKRTLSRERASSIRAEVKPERPMKIAARCRPGLERILQEELATVGEKMPKVAHDPPGGVRVELSLTKPLSALFQARTMLSFALALPARALRAGEDVADAVAERLLSREAGAALRGLTSGPVRYRVAWAAGGKRRAMTWKVAQAVQARAPDLVNDPRDSVWEVHVHESHDRVRVELSPSVPDPRFAYRQGDVPAASHPTLAAALARIAGARPDDVVWDPFVGSGLELCERAKLGPYRRLIGSDIDPDALTVARKNLNAASAQGFELFEYDALSFGLPWGRAGKGRGDGEAPTLIITNPPMGRRVHRRADLGDMLERFIRCVAGVLAPGGRLVWISPMPARTESAAERSGLQAGLLTSIDMGGFEAQIQVFSREIDDARETRSAPRQSANRSPVQGESRHRRPDHDGDEHQDQHAAPGRPRGRLVGKNEPTPGRSERRRGGRT